MSATSASLEGQTIVDNSSPDVPFWVNPQYADVTDTISAEAYELVKTAETSAYNQTLARITSPKWSFSYRFTGTRISVVGVVIPYISGPLAAAHYAVDGAWQNTSSVPNATRILTGVNFYTSQWLPLGDHVLTVNVTTASLDAPYLFDYFVVDSTSAPASSSFSSSSSTSRSTLTPHLDQVSAAVSQEPFPTGAVVGGVVGGVALLIAIALGIWWLRRHNRSYDESSYAYVKTGQYDPLESHIDVYPFAYSSISSMSSSRRDGSLYSDSPLNSPESHHTSGTQSHSNSPSTPTSKPKRAARTQPRLQAQPQFAMYSGPVGRAAQAQAQHPSAQPALSVSTANASQGSSVGPPTSVPPPYSP
ncbi:hypothetical protein C8Q76DRAFT_851561 [Earliella scabrosa]|nr:hypothetical protein C8Q76DRAFT_851561 [Earliella scabrosa]